MNQFSNVLSKVVLESAVGVADAEREAAVGRQDFRRLLEASPESLVGDHEIEQYIRQQYPGLPEPPTTLLENALDGDTFQQYLDSWTPGETALRYGEVHPDYVDEGVAATFPSLKRDLDIDVEEEITFRGDVPFLTEPAIAKIRRSVAQKLGRQRQQVFAQVAEQGLPRPIVEHMDVEMKVAFDDQLNAKAVNALETDVGIEPSAVGTVSARVQFKSE